MVDLAFKLTATGFTTPAEGRAILHAVAEALAGHGITHLMVEADADDPQWTSARPTAPLSLTGVAKYSNALDDTLVAAIPAACPAATAELEWEPANEGAMARQERVVHTYRLARMFNAVDDGAVARGYRRRVDSASVEDALLNAMADARVTAPIDWKASPDEVRAGLGQLRLLPDGDRTVAEAIPGYAELVQDDEEEPGDEQPYVVIGEAVRKGLEPVPAALLELSNGDTPCFLAAPRDLVDDLIEKAAQAGFDVVRFSP
jgi:hypothetical protein